MASEANFLKKIVAEIGASEDVAFKNQVHLPTLFIQLFILEMFSVDWAFCFLMGL